MTNATQDITTVNSSDILELQVDFAFAIFIPTLCFFIILGNLATIIAFWKVPSLCETPSELLILSLSCSDLTTGLIVIPLFSPMYITPQSWPFGELTCMILTFFTDLTLHSSLFTLCAISSDRFLLVFKDYSQYITTQSYSRIKKTIILGWVLSVTSGAVEISLWRVAKNLDETASSIDYDKYCLSPPRRMNSFALAYFLILYLTPVIIVCGLSVLFFCLLHQRLKHSWDMRAESQLIKLSKKTPQSHDNLSPVPSASSETQIANQALQNLQCKRYIKPAITLLALVTAMAVTTLPYCFYVIAVDICGECSNWSVLYTLLLLQFCNACIDPFIYAMTQRKIQKFFKSVLLRVHKKYKSTG